jgi:uncharacterized membrane-anchored protein YitT (DUF2179 family)
LSCAAWWLPRINKEAGATIKVAFIKSTVGIITGAVIAAVGLEAFLLPNHLLDGGIVGISIIGAQLLGLPIAVFLFFLNLPFIFLGYKKLGKQFAVASMIGIVALSAATVLLHNIGSATTEPILAAVFGGAIVGCGVGIVIRYGGTLDGAEIVAILADKRSPFSVGEVVMFMNLFIIGSAGFVFDWNSAMYSLIAYFVAFKVIDITVEGLNESKSVWIVSNEYKKIGQAIYDELGRKVTYVNGQSDAGLISDGVILSVITRIEEQHLKAIVKECDPSAFVVINSAHEVMGKNFINRPKKIKLIASLDNAADS